MFQNKVSYFLDLELSPDRITVYWKDTNTDQHVNFTSSVPWTYHTSLMRSLVTRESCRCYTDKILPENNTIKRFASWNNFTESFLNSIMKHSIHDLLLRTLMTKMKQAMKLLSIFMVLTKTIKVIT